MYAAAAWLSAVDTLVATYSWLPIWVLARRRELGQDDTQHL